MVVKNEKVRKETVNCESEGEEVWMFVRSVGREREAGDGTKKGDLLSTW